VAAGAGALSVARWIRWVSQFRGPFLENAANSWQDLWSPASIVIGGLLGSFVWMLTHRHVFTRAVWIAITVNWIAWAIFLLFMPRLTEADDRAILAHRASVDAGGPIDIFTDVPTALAGRWFGGFTPLNWDALLDLTAAPAVFVTQLEVVPIKYVATSPTRGESYAIAAIAFVLSTAFWANVGAAVSWTRSRMRRRGNERSA
jgi:hypothetical protein